MKNKLTLYLRLSMRDMTLGIMRGGWGGGGVVIRLGLLLV